MFCAGGTTVRIGVPPVFICVRSRIPSGACSRSFTNNFYVIERWMMFNGGLEISWQDFIIFILREDVRV